MTTKKLVHRFLLVSMNLWHCRFFDMIEVLT